jgi:alpha-galactosidase
MYVLTPSLLTRDNTWNAYACDINESVVLENALFLQESGLAKVGYDFFVIDGANAPRGR